ncbi:MAG: hypothetical protein AB1457_07750 [Chloroflexota bacterium]|nr:MAG: hypothetical protein KatS3mg045_1456 [Bellilinea sp.]
MNKWVLIWLLIIVSAILIGLMLAWGWNQMHQPASPLWGFMPSCSSFWSQNNGNFGMGPGMMNFNGYPNRKDQKVSALSSEDAIATVEQHLASLANPDLKPAEMMEFTENYYFSIIEESSGIHAMELLVDRQTGVIYPEPGPNMMWNLKYGHMGRMMGLAIRQPQSDMPITLNEAVRLAQAWLDENMPGMITEEGGDQFYGYYTIHVIKDGQIYGMLSVNGYTGQVWYHNWHGNFIAMEEMEEEE